MRARFAAVVGVGALMGVVGAAEPSLADPPGPNALPIHVIAIKTEEADAQADALTAALKAEVRRLQGWSLAEGDYSLEVLTIALRCPSPPDAACEMRIADEIKSDRYLWGTLDQLPGKRVAGKLHLWTRGHGETSVDVSYSSNLTEASDDALRKVVRDALAQLTGGPPKGTVKVTAGDINGQIFVDNEPSGAIKAGSATIIVSAGSHRIEIRAPGYANTSGQVTVSPNGLVSLNLMPIPEEAAGSGSKPNYRRIGGYGALAAGGVLAIGGVYSALKVNSINNDDGYNQYRRAMPKGASVCDEANSGTRAPSNIGAASPDDVSDMCSQASKFQALQWVFFGLSAVSVGAGTYLLVTDPSRERGAPEAGTTRVQVLPAAGRGSGGVDVRLVF